MKRWSPFLTFTIFCLLLSNSVFAQQKPVKTKQARPKTSASQQGSEKADSGKYIPVHTYDPARNAEQDIRDAVAEAERTGKRILLEVGGEWCIWCHIMDDYFEKNPTLLSLREKNFITVKINFSEENKNEPVLSRYPAISGYPFIFVLEKDGKLLHAQDTGKLEEGKSYNLAKFTAFLKEW
ncbi:MAG TPA: thioredoxin family protein, partial [Pyrinomonadaceae bacterium]